MKRKRVNTDSTAASAFRVFVNRLAVQARQPGARADPLLYAAARTSRNAYTVSKPALNEHRKRVKATRALAQWMMSNSKKKRSNGTGAEAAERGTVDVVKRLLARGANVNVLFSNNVTPLMTAIRLGYDKLVDVLINAGANLDTGDRSGENTPLLLAIGMGNLRIVQKLLHAGANVNHGNAWQTVPLQWAMINHRDVARNTADKIVIALLKAGANPNPPASLSLPDGTPFGIAIQRYIRTPEHLERNSVVVDRLIRAGADVNAAMDYNNDQTTPLHFAITYNSLQMVRKLLTAGADPNARVLTRVTGELWGTQGVTPLGTACYEGDGHLSIVAQLLKAGARVDSRNICYFGEWRGKNGDTALLLAARSKNPSSKVMTMLLDNGATANARGEFNMTPLMHLCGKKTLSILEVAVLRRLLKLGASVRDKDSRGHRSLTYAVRAKNEVAIKELLAAGADPTQI